MKERVVSLPLPQLFFLTLLLSVLTFGSARSQSTADTLRATAMTDSLRQLLPLTAAQAARIKLIYVAQLRQEQVDRKRYYGDRFWLTRAELARMQKTDQSIETILTLKQRKKYEELKKNRIDQMRNQLRDKVQRNP